MRFIILLTILFLLGGCGTFLVSDPAIDFMDKEEIVQMMTQDSITLKNGGTIEETDLSDEAKARESLLIPSEVFLKYHAKQTKNLYYLEESVGPQAASNKVDLSYRDTPVKRQVGPLCTAWATVAGMENMLNKKDVQKWDLSEQHLWSKYQRYSTNKAMEAANNFKIADEQYWPSKGMDHNADRYAHAKIAKSSYLSENINKVLAALDKGNVIQIAMRTPKDLLECKPVIRDGINQFYSEGGHAMELVGYEKDDRVTGGFYFKVKNSWGDSCGDNGYQYIPLYNTCRQNQMYCYYHEFIDVVSAKLNETPNVPEPPTPDTPEVPDTPNYVPKCIEWKKLWWKPKCWFSDKQECYECKEYKWIIVD